MTVILRLDPRFPLLWRDVHTLQFGAAHHAQHLSPLPWQERLLHDLTRGITETGLPVWAETNGIRRQYVDDLLALLGPALLRERLESHTPAAPRALVDASAAPPLLTRVFATGLAAAGWDLLDADAADGEPPQAALGIILCAHAMHPERAHPHLLADRPYLPIVATAGAITVGPLVVPGSSACTGCRDLHRRDDDSAWPVLATQLLFAPVADVPAAHAHEAAAVMLRALGSPTAWSLGVPQIVAGRSWTVQPSARGGSKITSDEVSPHPQCGCGAVEARSQRSRPASARIRRTGREFAASA